jgi:hypothetical protein
MLKITKTNNRLGRRVFHIILLYKTLTAMFNGVVNLFVATTGLLIIDVLFFSLFLFFNHHFFRKINGILFGFIVFYIFLSCFFLIFFVENNYYGFEKLVKNVIIMTFYFLFYFSLFKYSEKISLDKFELCLLQFTVLCEIVLFFIYILYNKKNGLIGNSVIQMIILQDFSGRFQGTFSEPSFLGFFLGTMALNVLILKLRCKYLISLLFVFILYYACGAKFALLSLPIASITGFFCIHFPKIKSIYLFLFLCFLICFIAYFYDDIINKFYMYIKRYIQDEESTGTFVTRFSFIFIAINKILLFPIGTGFGMNYEYFHDGLFKIINSAKSYHLSTFEIENYLNTTKNFSSKETFSVITSSFGFIGLFYYIKYFSKCLNETYNKKLICNILILFIFLQSLLSSSIFTSLPVSFVFVLYSRMALNENRKKITVY